MNKIKNYGFIIGLITSLGLLLPQAEAQSGVSLSFLNGYNLTVATNTTYTAGTTTNIYAKGFTVTNSATYPYTASYSPTPVTNANWSSDVPLWANRDGTQPLCNISVQTVGIGSIGTNVMTFTFAAVPAWSDSPDYLPITFLAGTGSGNQFSFSVTNNGTTAVVLATNVPAAFMQGARKLRLKTIAVAGATGTNATIAGIWLNGFKPPGAE